MTPEKSLVSFVDLLNRSKTNVLGLMFSANDCKLLAEKLEILIKKYKIDEIAKSEITDDSLQEL